MPATLNQDRNKNDIGYPLLHAYPWIEGMYGSGGDMIMITIDELIDMLNSEPEGRIFLVNLYRTIEREHELVPISLIKAACDEFLLYLNSGGYAIPSSSDLLDRLRGIFVIRGLWLYAPEPILERHLSSRQFTLARVISYGAFFHSIVRRRDSPSLTRSRLPEPIPLSPPSTAEIDPSNVSTVRRVIDTGKWKDDILESDLNLKSSCVWLTPLPKLMRKAREKPVSELSDFHRNVIGLSHIREGYHLIRLEFDLKKWSTARTNPYRRPHGAGNGGVRFRLDYDGRVCTCNWGRTVDLIRVAKKSPASLNGIPELLMEGFLVPKSAVTATYLGPVKSQPEKEDVYFLSRLLRTTTNRNDIERKMNGIVIKLKRSLA